MSRLPSWLRHTLFLAAAYTGVFFVMAFSSLLYFHDLIEDGWKNVGREMVLWSTGPDDATTVAKFDRFKALRESGPTIVGNLWLVDDRGNVIASTTDMPLIPYWRNVPLPTDLLEPVFGNTELFNEKRFAITKVRDNPARYLVGGERPELAANKPTVATMLDRFRFVYIYIFIGSTALLAALTVLYVFRTKAKEAGQVMEAIERGDLRSRFTVTKVDEIGGLMTKFNRMADTIESLVARLKNADQARISLLQELNHDLRTPLTSLHLIVETLNVHQKALDEAKRAGLYADLSKELAYVTRLVQFLFAVSEMEEATYRVDFAKEDLAALVQSEVELKRSTSGKPIEWIWESTVGSFRVDGDRALLGRLIRNSLDNAGKFAASKVHVRIAAETGSYRIEFRDDGPGPTSKAIARFGQRPQAAKGLEVLKPEKSAGLGSAIISAVAELHGGSARLDKAEAPWGALLTITLPQASGDSAREAA